jgi:predicted amidohydrolase YtcJ
MMPSADLILHNASVITMDAGRPSAQLVVVKGDRIIAVGDNGLLGEVRGTKTRVIDCGGKTVVPGFNDTHGHLFGSIRKRRSIDLSPKSVKSIADIKAAVRKRALDTPKGEWIIGGDYHEFYLAEKRHPNRRDLDEAAPDHPVALLHRSMHASVLNSVALARAGITRETPEPEGGVIDRELDTGEPSGVLFEMSAYVRDKLLPSLSPNELAEGIATLNKHYLELGITSLQDASVGNDHARWETLKRFKANESLRSRLSMMFGFDNLSQFQEGGLTFGAGNEGLRLGGVKFLLSEARDRLQPPFEELKEQALAAHEAGFQLAIHCVEPGTVEAAIATLEYIAGRSSLAERRHRLEHVSECPPELFKRLQKLEAVVVTQPNFVYHNGDRYLATVSPERRRWLYRIGSFFGAGLVVAAGSDSPVAPDNPWLGIYAAVTRQAQSGQQLLPKEAISVPQALALYTTNAAYASFEDSIKGSIAAGKLADMVILSADPLRSPPEKLKDIRVEMTIIGGKVAWED